MSKPNDPSSAQDSPIMPDSPVLADPASPEPASLPPPPSFGRQLAQLVLIPATIVLICVSFVLLFTGLMARPDSIDTHLMKLRSSSGAGTLPGGFQDPRYKDKSLAAYNIAQMIPNIKSEAEKYRVSSQLIQILQQNVTDDEPNIQFFLLMAIGQLGQEGGLAAIVGHFESDQSKVLEGAIGALLSWPDRAATRQAQPQLVAALQHPSALVRKEAAVALGVIAAVGDEQVIAALREAMIGTGAEQREVQWNAAVAAVRLGDAAAGEQVAQLLLNRQALAKLPAAETGPAAQRPMGRPMQDRIIIATLESVRDVTHPGIRNRIKQMADDDPSLSIRSRARELVREWDPAEP